MRLWTCLLALAALALFGLSALQPESANAGGEKATTITAEALAKEFAADPAKAGEKYFNKRLQVSGVAGGNMSSVLYMKTADKGPVVVRCDYGRSGDAAKAEMAKVKAGTKITVAGTYSNYILKNVELDMCEIVK